MAKVSEIKFNLKGIDYKVNVNCNSHGQFNANIPNEVAEALRISGELTNSNLSILKEEFQDCLRKYKTIQTNYETFIIVAYQARGKYIENKDGGYLFFYNDDRYKIDVTFSDITNAIGLDFKVAVKETIDGKSEWFEAKFKDGAYIKGYAKIRNSLLKRGKVIRFDQNALDTLNLAQERFRALSEMMFNFINQDEEKILLTLTSQKLLS